MARDRFTNPANGVTYNFQVNHDEEEDFGKTRTITRTAPTGGVGLVKQQGEDGPMLLKLSGKILHRSQYVEMWRWYALCRTQTIHFTDFDGQSYEVQITSFLPKRVRKLSHSGRDGTMPYHYWTYTMELEIYRFLTGDLAGVGVTP